MTAFDQIASRIVKEQELIIGPLAWEEAQKVQGLQVVNVQEGQVHLEDGDLKIIVDKLVAQYERLFGRASHEVCKEAVQDLIAEMAPEEVPESLKN